MKPAVKTALAFLHLTGSFPKHIHTDTFSEAYRHIDQTRYPYKLKPETVELIADHPFILGRDYLVSIGYLAKAITYPKKTSHCLKFFHSETMEEAHITREGKGSWIWTKNERGGLATTKIDKEFMK